MCPCADRVSGDSLGLLCWDEVKDDFFGLERGKPKRLCRVLRAPECFGVVGLDERGGGMGMIDGRFRGRGVAGVTVVLVAVVVDDKGREGIRDEGLEGPML